MSRGFSFFKFVLKHKEFAYLRETENFTNSVCPNNKGKFIDTFQLILLIHSINYVLGHLIIVYTIQQGCHGQGKVGENLN